MKTFRDYAEYNEEILAGFTVVKASTGINAAEEGIMLELEKEISGGIIGVDIIYNPEPEEGETPFMISHEYIKRVH